MEKALIIIFLLGLILMAIAIKKLQESPYLSLFCRFVFLFGIIVSGAMGIVYNNIWLWATLFSYCAYWGGIVAAAVFLTDTVL